MKSWLCYVCGFAVIITGLTVWLGLWTEYNDMINVLNTSPLIMKIMLQWLSIPTGFYLVLNGIRIQFKNKV